MSTATIDSTDEDASSNKVKRIIIGSSVSFNDSGASSIFYTRIMLIFLAGVYVVAYSVVEALYREHINKGKISQQTKTGIA